MIHTTYTPISIWPLIKQNRLKYNLSEVDAEAALILFYKISILNNENFTYKDKNDKVYKNISKELFISWLGKLRYFKILSFLKDLQIIECIETYKPGSYSKAYRINDIYINGNLKPNLKPRKIKFKVNINRELKQKSYLKIKKTEKVMKSKEFKTVNKNFKNTRVSENVYDFIGSDYYPKEFFDNIPLLNDLIITNKFGLIPILDDQGRMYHSANRVPKFFRQFFYDQREGFLPTIEVDISSSHAFLVTELMKNKTDDILFWNDLVETGMLYEYISQQINISIKTVKSLVIKHLLYSENMPDKVYTKIFNNFIKKEFPTIWNNLILMKKEYGNKKLARKIMKLEADLMIKGVLVNLDCWAIPIHDGILCYEKDCEKVKDMIVKVYKEKLNRIPDIKLKG